MSGHSHWAGIKHHKGINDAKRAAIFTKAGRNIILAAERGGSNPDTNYALKIAIDAARSVNMPKDKIERAVKRGTGELVGEKIESIMYEGFLPVRSQAKEGGPNNVALLIETMTDNKNRTVSELKSLLTKNGGKFGAPGSVSFLFRPVGLVTFSFEQYSREQLELEAIESGADDFAVENNRFVVYTAPDQFQVVQQYFTDKNISPTDARLGFVPLQKVAIDSKAREVYGHFLELLADYPDVQAVWDNVEPPRP